MDCIKVIDNIVAFRQNEITDDSLRRDISSHVQKCERCRREDAEVRRTLEIIRDSDENMVPSDRVWAQLMQRLTTVRAGLAAGEESGAAETATALAAEHAASPRFFARRITVPRYRRVWAVAAGIALLAGIAAVLLLLAGGFTVEYVKGPDVSLFHGGDSARTVKTGHRFVVGDRIEVGPAETEPAVLRYPDGSTLSLEDGANLAFSSENRVQLNAGALHAKISKSGIGFVVSTRFGQARVSGTDFTITVGESQTTLEVQEGSVEFTNGGKTVVVNGGSASRAVANREPDQPYPQGKGRPTAPAFSGDENIELSLSAFDPLAGRYFGESEGREIELPDGATLRIRFTVTNMENHSLRLPSGNTIDRVILRVSTSAAEPGSLVTSLGVFVGGEENPLDGTATVESLMAYRFVFEINPAALGLKAGKTYYISGGYFGCYNRRPLKIKIAPPPEPSDAPRPDGGERD